MSEGGECEEWVVTESGIFREVCGSACKSRPISGDLISTELEESKLYDGGIGFVKHGGKTL